MKNLRISDATVTRLETHSLVEKLGFVTPSSELGFQDLHIKDKIFDRLDLKVKRIEFIEVPMKHNGDFEEAINNLLDKIDEIDIHRHH